MLHSIMITMPFLIQSGSLNQLGPSIPTRPSIWFSSPFEVSSSRKSVPTATAGVTFGR
jgi:hypothetical protein